MHAQFGDTETTEDLLQQTKLGRTKNVCQIRKS